MSFRSRLYRLTPKTSDALIITALGKARETQGKGEVSCHEDYRADNGHYEAQDVELGRVYRWQPGRYGRG